MKRSLLSLSALLGVGAAPAAEHPATVAGLFGSPENIRLVREADKVDLCILKHVAPAELPDGRIDWKTEHYEDTAFTPAPAATAAALRELLLSEKTYDWTAHGGRRPQLYLRLRFHQGDDFMTLDFCFICHVVLVSHHGTEVGHANFSPNSDLLLQAFLKVFPDDGPLRQVAKEAGLPL